MISAKMLFDEMSFVFEAVLQVHAALVQLSFPSRWAGLKLFLDFLGGPILWKIFLKST